MMIHPENAQVVAKIAKYRSSTYWEVSAGIFLLVLVFGIVTPIALMIWQATAATAAVRTGDAGRFVSATVSRGGFFSTTLTSVQTTEGSVLVEGLFSAPRGRVLAIEESNKSGLHLCAVGDPDTCLPLAGPWAGQLTATPQASGVFDFVGHGLSSDNLGRWLGAGLIFAFIVFGGIFAVGVGGERRE